ncbi:type VI secretion system baseplate subunit TssF [Reinekea forsetii]|nr:type VI secretion system baseplate subunit TssF [Reinekea forsetii]
MLSYREYFEAEMRTLQDLAQEFADAYPEQAAMLNLSAIKDRDPYVERLLEGMAFLTSQIRHRLDDAVPEISESLLEQVMPALIKPYPANTILEFSVNAFNRESISIEAGQSVRALNAGPLNANCEFTTTHPVKLLPITLTEAVSDERVGGGTQIQLTFQKNQQAKWKDIDLASIKLYLCADWTFANALFHCLTDKHGRVAVSSVGRLNISSSKPITIVPAHQTAKDGLLPSNGRTRTAFSLMHDYFCAREKYLFTSIEGLEGLNLPKESSSFTIELVTPERLPIDTILSKDHIRLNSTPAINLYTADAEPISVDHTKSEYRVNPDRQVAEYSTVFSVESVSSRDQSTGETYQYTPLHAMRHRKQDDRVYFTKNRTAGVDKRLTYISLNSPPPFKPEVASIETYLCNDQYPRRYVEIGAINKLPEVLARDLEVKNLTRPSKLLQAPSFQDYQWQLISILSLNLSSLESVDNLKHLLSLFDWTDQLENKRKIESIATIRTKTTHRLRRGVLFQGLEVSLELNETGFSSLSDMYLFGSVLHNFFSGFANMTEFVQTKIVQLPSYKEWMWSPVFGSKTLF